MYSVLQCDANGLKKKIIFIGKQLVEPIFLKIHTRGVHIRITLIDAILNQTNLQHAIL